jgi:murein DD-endopeptidase MepM/ murein hydrolase activator NlpD
LGISGNTGLSTGAHLHRALYSYLEDYDNGYHGAISPEPFFINIFVNDFIETIEKQKINLLQAIVYFLKDKISKILK